MNRTSRRPLLRFCLGNLQIFAAGGLLATYLRFGRHWLTWCWLTLALASLAASRALFYQRFWWSWSEKDDR